MLRSKLPAELSVLLSRRSETNSEHIRSKSPRSQPIWRLHHDRVGPGSTQKPDSCTPAAGGATRRVTGVRVPLRVGKPNAQAFWKVSGRSYQTQWSIQTGGTNRQHRACLCEISTISMRLQPIADNFPRRSAPTSAGFRCLQSCIA